MSEDTRLTFHWPSFRGQGHKPILNSLRLKQPLLLALIAQVDNAHDCAVLRAGATLRRGSAADCRSAGSAYVLRAYRAVLGRECSSSAEHLETTGGSPAEVTSFASPATLYYGEQPTGGLKVHRRSGPRLCRRTHVDNHADKHKYHQQLNRNPSSHLARAPCQFTALSGVRAPPGGEQDRCATPSTAPGEAKPSS